jgi:hypothetical protein
MSFWWVTGTIDPIGEFTVDNPFRILVNHPSRAKATSTKRIPVRKHRIFGNIQVYFFGWGNIRKRFKEHAKRTFTKDS